MATLITFLVENFWLILAVLLMARYSRFASICLTVLIWTTNPGLGRTIGVWVCVLFAIGLHSAEDQLEDKKPSNDPDYD